jgi:hypothetical protein
MMPHDGLQLDGPHLFIPWNITEDELVQLVGIERLRHVTAGYYTMTCQSMGGLTHRLGFHFAPRESGRLAYFEFFQDGSKGLRESFDAFQRRLVVTFGKPTSFGRPYDDDSGEPALPTCRWEIAGTEILHYVMDRFGPEEHLTMRKLS